MAEDIEGDLAAHFNLPSSPPSLDESLGDLAAYFNPPTPPSLDEALRDLPTSPRPSLDESFGDLAAHFNPPFPPPSLNELFRPVNLNAPPPPPRFKKYLGNYIEAADIHPPNCQEMVLEAIRELDDRCTDKALRSYMKSTYGEFHHFEICINASIARLTERELIEKRPEDSTYVLCGVYKSGYLDSRNRQHVHYSEMVLEAIRKLDERDGSSEGTIIESAYSQSPAMSRDVLKLTLERLLEQGDIEVSPISGNYIVSGHYVGRAEIKENDDKEAADDTKPASDLGVMEEVDVESYLI